MFVIIINLTHYMHY